MTTLERTILDDITRYERESGRKLPDKSFYKSIVLDIMRREVKNGRVREEGKLLGFPN